MPIKVEAALVTQKRPHAQFNSDSVNINGKVLSRDIILNGYKGSGVMSGSVYFALTSSPVEGFADAAVAAFNDRASDFSDSAQDPENVIKDYFLNCSAALEDMNHSGDELAAAILFASGRKVIVANSGETKLYYINKDEFKALEPEFGADGFGIISFPDVSEGDIFILAGPGISDVMSDKDVCDICKISDGSVKKAVSLISKVALAKPGVKAASVVAVKVAEISLDTDKVEAGFVPDFSVFDDKAKENVSDEEKISEETNVDENAEDATAEEEKAETESDPVPDDGMSETEKTDDSIMEGITEQLDDYVEDINAETEIIDSEDEPESDEEITEKKNSKKYIPVIVTLVAAIAVFAAAFFIVRALNGRTAVPEETTDEIETISETKQEATSEEESATTDETTSEEKTTEESTTKKTPVWKPQKPEKPIATSAATSSKPTTTVPAETTTASAETTTAAAETTTVTAETTTVTAETTTASAETTKAPAETTTADAETTKAPAETTTASVSETENTHRNTEQESPQA